MGRSSSNLQSFYLTLSNTVEQQIPFLREKLLSTFELQNIYVLSYIGAVLHKATTKQDLGKYKEDIILVYSPVLDSTQTFLQKYCQDLQNVVCTTDIQTQGRGIIQDCD